MSSSSLPPDQQHDAKPLQEGRAGDPGAVGRSSPAQGKDKAVGLSASLTTLLKFGGVVTALGALVGWLYHQGQMEGMEIPADLFPVKIEDLFFLTYFAALRFSHATRQALAEHLLFLVAGTVAMALVIGLVLNMWIWVERKFDWRGWATEWLQEQAAKRRVAFVFAVGLGSGVGVVGMLAALAMSLGVLVLLPAPAYLAGREEGSRKLSVSSCKDGAGHLLARCAEVTFENGDRIVGVYLAGEAGKLALRVDGESVVYTQPARVIRFGSHPRTR